ncbi:hypothetical protein INS49_008710 [Diaporthe citri]|uniref:uncharacterized protein n=1 Tax=Diaporthe citri TaxID=83186 RepID=UPI001C7EDF50|nr:uncharacterized protein INS49_008710 [Diaporthe citri]KAG6363609.1 hypothetical protein INS49_008710 [Diaporthe citri]
MADQQHDQQKHPPEKKSTTRRATVNTQKEAKSVWSLFRRGQAQAVQKGEPVQDHVSCYANLHWDVLHGYLDTIFPGWDFQQRFLDLRGTKNIDIGKALSYLIEADGPLA